MKASNDQIYYSSMLTIYLPGNSDFVIIVKAYNGWRQALKNQGWAFMKRYCDQNYLSLQVNVVFISWSHLT